MGHDATSDGLAFISMMYSHEPPNFRTTWRHFLQSCNKSAFCNRQVAIIQAIVTTSTNGTNIDDTAPFWWLLLHLDMLIFAPLTRKQCNNSSIQETIRDRINAAFSSDIAYLHHSAMQVRRLTQNTRPTASTGNRTAQRAADNDDYRTAILLACSLQSIATIGPSNISHVNKLYTQPLSATQPSTPTRHTSTPTLLPPW